MESVRDRAVALARELLDRLGTEGIRDLEVREDGLRVRVVSADAAVAAQPAATQVAARIPEPSAPATPAGQMASVVVSSAPAASGARVVNAPLTGVFYRSASPQSPAFVQEGSVVAVGDVIGLIEAMKLFNEIKSTAAGRVKKIVAENGKLVRAHAPLLELE